MSEPCGNCGALMARIAALQAQVDYLNQRIAMLQSAFAQVHSFIVNELEPGQATMSRRDALEQTAFRIQFILEAGVL